MATIDGFMRTARFLTNKKYTMKLDELEKLDYDHWNFVIVYKTIFDVSLVP